MTHIHFHKINHSGLQVLNGQMKLESKDTLMEMLQHMHYAMRSLQQVDLVISVVILV